MNLSLCHLIHANSESSASSTSSSTSTSGNCGSSMRSFSAPPCVCKYSSVCIHSASVVFPPSPLERSWRVTVERTSKMPCWEGQRREEGTEQSPGGVVPRRRPMGAAHNVVVGTASCRPPWRWGRGSVKAPTKPRQASTRNQDGHTQIEMVQVQ